MRLKKLLVTAISIVLGLALCTTAYAAADKVGYINLQRLVNESKMGKDAAADIQKMRKEKEAVLAGKLQDFNKLKDFINKEGAKMPNREKRDKIELLQKMSKEYQRMFEDAKEDITREDRELVAIILQKADDILKSIAKRKGYGIILKDPNAVGYLDPDVDITDMVLEELNKKK